MDANLQKYLAFVKAVEYKSFTKAALALNYSQSGISCMISDLEKEWDMILFKVRYHSYWHIFQCGHSLAP